MIASMTNRPARARTNAALARSMLAECRFCAHDCAVNRLAGPGGRCHAGADTRCFCAQVEVTDELELIPTYAVAFSGCDLRCAFCITGAESWDARAGEPFDALLLKARCDSGGGEMPFWQYAFIPATYGQQVITLRKVRLELKRPLLPGLLDK